MRDDEITNYEVIKDAKSTPQDAYVLVGSSLFRVKRGFIVKSYELVGNCMEDLIESARRITQRKLYVDEKNLFNEYASHKAGYLTSDMDFSIEDFYDGNDS